MQRFVLSSLSLLAAVGIIAPVAQAQEVEKTFNLQEVRLEAWDARQKSSDSLAESSLQQCELPA
ncbi:MAG: hypothetical protein F6J97_21255, partial [Leptolyngbya sp. SIO4C1]|nr:hypothetical protein [Leptolyngbya sp. SIO4C1]